MPLQANRVRVASLIFMFGPPADSANRARHLESSKSTGGIAREVRKGNRRAKGDGPGAECGHQRARALSRWHSLSTPRCHRSANIDGRCWQLINFWLIASEFDLAGKLLTTRGMSKESLTVKWRRL